MASSVKLCSVLLLLTLLFLQIHARESSFFSKVSNNGDKEETHIPKFEPLTNPEKKEQQEPNFIPQTQNSGYGLYGHESGQLPPSDAKFSDPAARGTEGRPFTTSTSTSTNYNNYQNDDVSYKAESEEYYEEDNNNDNFQNGNSKPYEKSYYYNKDLYDKGRRNFGNTRLSRGDYTTTPLYEQEKNNYYNGGGGGESENNVAERQGMSDTRFVENGKYFYDIDREPHHYRNSRGYFGNSNGNTYEYGNSMGGSRYQNGGTEFQEEPDQFLP